MAADETTVEALRARLGRTVESLLSDGGAGRFVTRRATVGGHEVAAPRRRPVSDERLHARSGEGDQPADGRGGQARRGQPVALRRAQDERCWTGLSGAP